MAFNHYTKLLAIITAQQGDWIIVRIDEPTSAKGFNGEVRHFTHYYRLCDSTGAPLKYGKFQQIDKLAAILKCSVEELPIVTQASQL